MNTALNRASQPLPPCAALTPYPQTLPTFQALEPKPQILLTFWHSRLTPKLCQSYEALELNLQNLPTFEARAIPQPCTLTLNPES
jgi:hypothetical protein